MIPDMKNSIERDGYTFVESFVHGDPNRKGVFDAVYIPHWLDETALDEIVRYINTNNLYKVYADSLRSFAFLRNCPRLTCVTLSVGAPLQCDIGWADQSPHDGEYGLDFLYDLPMLSELNIYDSGSPSKTTVKKVDLGRLKALNALTTEYAYVRNLESAAGLESLYIRGLRTDDLTCVSGMRDLKFLAVVQGTVKSLHGIENTKVETLQVAYCRNLQDISAISGLSQTLTNLSIDHCAKIHSIDACADLTCLEAFEINGSNSIQSLHPLDGLKRLRILLAYINVEDGDMMICKKMKLSGFKNKKHYNLKSETLPN